MQAETKRRLSIIARIAAISTVFGAVYGYAVGAADIASIVRGALNGLLISSSLAGFEFFVVTQPLGARLRRLGFVPLIATKTTIYLAFILVAQFAAAHAVSGPAGVLAFDAGLIRSTLFSLAVATGFTFVVQVNRMLGQGELARFVRGRYHRPRIEERIFLLLDLEGSTTLAEQLGGERLLALLNDAYDDMTGPVLEARGEIHKYVGDEVIVTWAPGRGLYDARCVVCPFAIVDALAHRGEYYRQRYGTVPAFRTALHIGSVVSGELGSLKQEIAYIGDAINVAARLIDACRALNRRHLVSQALLDRLRLPDGIVAEPLEPQMLRGRSASLAVAALERPGHTA